MIFLCFLYVTRGYHLWPMKILAEGPRVLESPGRATGPPGQASRVVFALRGNRRFGTRSWRDLEDLRRASKSEVARFFHGKCIEIYGNIWKYMDIWWFWSGQDYDSMKDDDFVKDDDFDGKKNWESIGIGSRTVGPVLNPKLRWDF